MPIAAAVGMLLLLLRRHYRHRRGFPEFERQLMLMSPQQRAMFRILTKLVGAYSVALVRVNLSTLVKSPGEDPRYEAH